MCFYMYQHETFVISPMKCEVQLFIAGKIVKETMTARDYSHAREIANSRYPNSTILGVNAIFDNERAE